MKRFQNHASHINRLRVCLMDFCDKISRLCFSVSLSLDIINNSCLRPLNFCIEWERAKERVLVYVCMLAKPLKHVPHSSVESISLAPNQVSNHQPSRSSQAKFIIRDHKHHMSVSRTRLESSIEILPLNIWIDLTLALCKMLKCLNGNLPKCSKHLVPHLPQFWYEPFYFVKGVSIWD